MKFTKNNIATLSLIILIIILAVLYTQSIVHKHNLDLVMDSEAGTALLTTSENDKFTDLSGNSADLTDYIGDVLVVNSWASWSPFSVKELSELSSVASEYEEQGVKIVAINRSESTVAAERFLETINGYEDIILIIDPDDRFYKSVKGYTMPETLFYDSLGSVVHHNHGPMTSDEIRLYIEKALNSSE